LSFVLLVKQNPSFLEDDELLFFLPHIIDLLETKDPASLGVAQGSREENLIRFCCYTAHTLYEPIVSLQAAIEVQHIQVFGEPLTQDGFKNIRHIIRAFLIRMASSGYEHSHAYVENVVTNENSMSLSRGPTDTLSLRFNQPLKMPQREEEYGICPALKNHEADAVEHSVFVLSVDAYLDAIQKSYESSFVSVEPNIFSGRDPYP